MALSAGTQIGPYRIVDRIGAGGMGEVYRATDTKLGRDVAIKTLPTALAQEPDRLARFEREAKLLATLNHAHIGAIYGLDEHEGMQFIAMELVEGQTLEEKLKAGALPVEDALQIALQIAEALEAAHEKGVVHRDLKPANIMLTRDGVVKVLDFGLAKAFLGDPNDASPAHSPALSMAMTQQGLILGTAGYMSPEQASGQATDQRADVWAFGVVLYEMLTGLPLFSGESVPHILADVLRTEPEWNRLPKNVNPRLKLLLARCLKKRVRDRYHSISDARVDVEEILADPRGLQADLNLAGATQARRIFPWLTVAIASSAGLTALIAWSLWPAPSTPSVTRFEHALPLSQTLRQPGYGMLAISRDGRQLIYNTFDGLYLRTMDQLDARLISGTEPIAVLPSFSPDGRAVAYWSVPGQLTRIAINGGAAVGLTPAMTIFGMSWQSDGTILYGQPEGIFRISANGGMPEQIVERDRGAQYGAELLPDGDSVLFSQVGTADWDTSQIIVQSLSTGERKVLFEGGNDARYLPTGHIVYAIGGVLFAIAFDLDALSVYGGAVPVLQGVMRSTTGESGVAQYDVSDNGTLVYVTGGVDPGTRTLVWVDRDSREEPINMPPRSYMSPRLSPDGTKIAINPRDQEQDIWIWDLARSTLTRLTFDPGQDRFPTWSPDGTRIIYAAQQSNGLGNDLVSRAADGTGPVELLAESGGEIWPHSFLPDATALVVYGDFSAANANEDIAMVPLDGSESVQPLLHSPFSERMPEVSPDGRWLAYSSNESGSDEIYVRSFPDVESGGRWQVSTGGGQQPLWARDGTELFYRNGAALMTVSVETEPTFAAGNPEVVFQGDYATALGGRTYDVSLDGERFLMMKENRDSVEPSKIIVVENWFEELKRLVPTQ